MRIAIVGGGVVGGGVIEVLSAWSDIEVKYLGVKDVNKMRYFSVPSNCTVTTDIDTILADDSIEMIVELMGGVDPAWHVIQTALKKGKHVVTANKALISKHIIEIESILSSMDSPPFFLYEAAVCGGIPVINTFIRGMSGDQIVSIKGVMNGSTNWMLGQMQARGVGFSDLLDEAKKLGYLEADPSADVLGWDARSKLCILARIAFGKALHENEVVCLGIDRIGTADIDFARKSNRAVRLVALAWTEGNDIHAAVMPSMVQSNDPLFDLPGATNCVVFNAKNSLTNVLVGSGAGRYPTANSVVADILAVRNLIDLGAQKGSHPFGRTAQESKTFARDFSSKFYIRARAGGEMQAMLEKAGISFEMPQPDIFVTSETLLSALERIVSSKQCAVVMRML